MHIDSYILLFALNFIFIVILDMCFENKSINRYLVLPRMYLFTRSHETLREEEGRNPVTI